MYAEEKNRLECSCMGARNKVTFKMMIRNERSHLENQLKRLEDDYREIKSSDPTELLDTSGWLVGGVPEKKHILIGDTEKLIHSVNNEIIHNKMLYDVISNIPVCGD